MWQDWWEHDSIPFRGRNNFEAPFHHASTGWWGVDQPMPNPQEGDTDWSFDIPAHRRLGVIAYPTIRQVLNQRAAPFINAKDVNDYLASMMVQDQNFPNFDWFEPVTDVVPVRCYGRQQRQQEKYLAPVQSENTTASSGQTLSGSTIEYGIYTYSCSDQAVLFGRKIDRDRLIQLHHDLQSTTALFERLLWLAGVLCNEERMDRNANANEDDEHYKMTMMHSTQSHQATLQRLHRKKTTFKQVSILGATCQIHKKPSDKKSHP